MQVTNTAYDVDGIQIPWGETFPDVKEKLKDILQFPPYGGWPNLRCQCREIFCLEATEFQATAPLTDRPVIRIQYELAPMKIPLFAKLHVPFLAGMQQMLGAPDEATSHYRSLGHLKGYGSGEVVYHAKWNLGDVSIGLSVYGGTRKNEAGLAAAGLYIHWDNEIKAAVPYRKERMDQETKMEAAVTTISRSSMKIYKLQQQQGPFVVMSYGRPTPEGEHRAAQLALYKHHVLHTPEMIRSKIIGNEVALYYLEPLQSWFLSNRWDTTPIAPHIPNKAVFYDVFPGRGPGYYQLIVNDLRIDDSRSNPALYELVKELEKATGIAVEIFEEYDA